MSKIGLIIKSEYMSRVAKKTFLLLTFLMPVLFVAIAFVPLWLSKIENADNKKIAIVDNSGKYSHIFTNANEYHFELIDSIKSPENRSEYEAFIVINQCSDDEPKVTIYSEKHVPAALKTFVEDKLNKFIRDEKIASCFIPDIVQIMSEINSEIIVSTVKWSNDGNEGVSSPEIAGVVGIIFTMLIYVFIFVNGSQVMNSVIQEKVNRIVEVMLCSVKPFELMMGKIVSIALVGLTQFSMWILLSIILFGIGGFLFIGSSVDLQQTAQFISASGTDTAFLSEEIITSLLSINFVEIITCFFLYFIGGYMLYASIFAAIGSAVDNETDTQQFMLPITIPILFAIYAAIYSIQNPDGPLAFWCSIVPFTSPIVMMVRLPFGVPMWEKILSLSLLTITFICTTWMAGKIYRTGILMYGKKPSWKELWKWLKYKN